MLTRGFCELVHSEGDHADVKPILQVLSVKKINAQNATGQDRYRWVISRLLFTRPVQKTNL